MRYLVPVGVYIALVAYCVTDVLNHDDRYPFGVHKALWIVIIVLFPYAGAIAWLIVKLRGRGGRGARREPRPPDDDPDYMRWLREQERRRRRT